MSLTPTFTGHDRQYLPAARSRLAGLHWQSHPEQQRVYSGRADAPSSHWSHGHHLGRRCGHHPRLRQSSREDCGEVQVGPFCERWVRTRVDGFGTNIDPKTGVTCTTLATLDGGALMARLTTLAESTIRSKSRYASDRVRAWRRLTCPQGFRVELDGVSAAMQARSMFEIYTQPSDLDVCRLARESTTQLLCSSSRSCGVSSLRSEWTSRPSKRPPRRPSPTMLFPLAG